MIVEGLEKQPELDTVDIYGKSKYFGDSFDAYADQNSANLLFHNDTEPEDVLRRKIITTLLGKMDTTS